MNQRYFTLEEAEALLPDLERILAAVRDLKSRVDAKIADCQERGVQKPAETAVAKGQVDFLIAEINQRMEEIYKLGCLPKDLDQGLVDFPARSEGREGYLCWKSGEKRIGFWHGLTEGFQGRKPLKRPLHRS